MVRFLNILIISVLLLGIVFSNILYAQGASNGGKVVDHDEEVAEAESLLIEAQSYYDMDSLDQCIRTIHMAEELLERKKVPGIRVELFILEGFAYLYSGDPGIAFASMFDAYKKSKEEQLDTLLYRSAAGLGIISRMLREFDESHAYFNEALEISKRLNLTVEKVKLLNEIGSTYLLQNELEKALFEYRKVHEIGRELNDSQLLSVSNSNLASVNLELKRYAEALEAYEENLNVFGKYLGLKNRIVTMLNAGEVCTRTGNYDKASKYLSEALDLSRDNELPSLEIEALKRLSYLFEREGDYLAALIRYQDYTRLKDSVYSIEKQRQIMELQNQYKLEQNQLKISLFQQRVKNRNITIVLMVLIIVALFMGYMYYRRTTSLRIKVKEAEKQKILQQVESRNRELVSLALNLGQKKQLLAEIESLFKRLQSISRVSEVRTLLRDQKSKLNLNNYVDQNWEHFTRHFEQVHPQFFMKLQEQYPSLTSNDLIHCAFIKLMLKQKEVALFLNINERSVQMIRYRLKKKLDLHPEDDLNAHILSFG